MQAVNALSTRIITYNGLHESRNVFAKLFFVDSYSEILEYNKNDKKTVFIPNLANEFLNRNV